MSAWALRRDNPMMRVLAALLGCEALMSGIAIFAFLYVGGLSVLHSVLLGGGAALLAILAMVLLRSPVGMPLGWLAQAGQIALGLVLPIMYAVGGMFVLIWVLTIVLGAKLEQRAEASSDR